jgi:hypothetical protein
VIGMGTETDPDAEFLKDVARRGQGRIYFSANVDDLPRLFAEEAITVARSSFVSDPLPRTRWRTWCCLATCLHRNFPMWTVTTFRICGRAQQWGDDGR